MKNKFIRTATLCLLVLPGFSQVQLERFVISGGGDFSSAPGVSLSYTVGEAITTTRTNPSVILTQGFQQPDPVYVSLPESPFGFSVLCYPNPVAGQLTIEFLVSEPSSMIIELHDLAGRAVMKNTVAHFPAAGTHRVSLDLHHVNPSIYLVVIRNSIDLAPLRTIRIFKPI